MKYIPPKEATGPNDPYQDYDKARGLAGSRVFASAIEHPQREIIQAIVAAGLTPSETNLAQLAEAIPILGKAAVGDFCNIMADTVTGGTIPSKTVTTLTVNAPYVDGENWRLSYDQFKLQLPTSGIYLICGSLLVYPANGQYVELSVGVNDVRTASSRQTARSNKYTTVQVSAVLQGNQADLISLLMYSDGSGSKYATDDLNTQLCAIRLR